MAEFAALGPGAWSWFADPRALFHAGVHRRTYVGWLDTGGNVRVAAHDHDTGARTVAIVRHGLGIDDHGNPALLLRHDGRLQVFYSAHNGSAMHYRIAQSPEDVSAWSPERSLGTNTPGGRGFTYPNPVRLRAELDRIHLFWRGGDWEPAFSTSLDGLSWAPARTVIDAPGQRPYVKVAGNGEDRIHLAFTDGHPRNTPTSVYYARYRNGAWSRANAQHICTVEQLPFAPHQADVVYDVTQRRFRSWVHDVAFDAEGRPLIVFAIFRSPTDHHYHYARWTGSAWEDHFVTAAGGFIDDDGNEVQYSGGITFDHEDPQVVYLSRQVTGQWEVERWRTADGGRSFTHTAVTAGSPQKNVRPVTPRNQHEGDLNVLWMRGSYRNYRDYNTTIVGDPSGGWESPFAEATATPAAGPPPLSVTLDGTSSGVAAGSTITGWEWDFGDGTPPAAVAQVQHTYNTSGVWWPSLTVTNQDGATDTIAIEVNVEAT